MSRLRPKPKPIAKKHHGKEVPGDLKALGALIASRREHLPKRLNQVADFALSQPQEVAFGTVVEIAGHAGVQPSALVRFARALGYDGFSAMQEVFRAHARKRWPDYPQRLETVRAKEEEGDANPVQLLRNFAQTSAESLEHVTYSVNPASLQQAIALLADAQIIYLLASRRSFPVASYLAYALRQMKVRCELVDQVAGLAPEQVSLLTAKDALLVVSFAPYADTTRALATAAAGVGSPVVSITDSPFSPLVQISSCWLEVSESDFGGFRSLAATLAVAMTLAVAVARWREDRRV